MHKPAAMQLEIHHTFCIRSFKSDLQRFLFHFVIESLRSLKSYLCFGVCRVKPKTQMFGTQFQWSNLPFSSAHSFVMRVNFVTQLHLQRCLNHVLMFPYDPTIP